MGRTEKSKLRFRIHAVITGRIGLRSIRMDPTIVHNQSRFILVRILKLFRIEREFQIVLVCALTARSWADTLLECIRQDRVCTPKDGSPRAEVQNTL